MENLFTDEYFMKKALFEAETAFEKGEIPIGAVIVVGNKVIASSHNLTEMLNDVTAHADGRTFLLEGHGQRFRVSRERFDIQEGQALTLGVRPSSLFSGGNPEERENSLRGVADLIEFHGDNALVSFRVGDKEIGALVPATDRPQRGATMAFSVREENLHLFDRATGLSVSRVRP